MKRCVMALLTAMLFSGILFGESDGQCYITKDNQEQFYKEDLLISRALWLLDMCPEADFDCIKEAVETNWNKIVAAVEKSGTTIPPYLMKEIQTE